MSSQSWPGRRKASPRSKTSAAFPHLGQRWRGATDRREPAGDSQRVATAPWVCGCWNSPGRWRPHGELARSRRPGRSSGLAGVEKPAVRLPEVLHPLADFRRAPRRSMSHADDRPGGGRGVDIERVDRGTRHPPWPRARRPCAGGLRSRDARDLLVYQRMVAAGFLLVAGNYGPGPRRPGDWKRPSRSGIGADGCHPPVLLRVRRCLDRHFDS